MANQSIVNQDMHVRGTLSCERFVAPSGSINNAAVGALADLDESKLQHRHVFAHQQSGAVAAATQYLCAMRFDGAVLAIEAAIVDTIATGADRTVEVDLQKSTAGGAFASILTATIDFDDDSVLRDLTAGAIAAAGLLDGDLLRIVVTVAGAAGNQAIGLLVTVTLSELGQ